MSPYTRVVVVLVAVLALQLVRCGDEHEPPADLPDVVYEGTASDEALEAVWPRLGEAEADDDFRLLAPEEDVPASPSPEIRWSGEEASLPPGPALERWPLPLGPRVAAAHLPPVTGMVYLVELEGAGTVRVFTDRTSFTPGESDWARLHGGGARTVEVRLYRAYLVQNAVTEGPFRGADGSFRVLAP